MNQEFLDLYNRELKLLNEQAREFADEYPGIAERLGGLLEDRIDPLIGGLLEGAAFLAAGSNSSSSTNFPNSRTTSWSIRPSLSGAYAVDDAHQGVPTFGDKALRDGHPIPRGSYLDAAFRQLDRQIACRYRLCGDIAIWPFELVAAEYLSSPAPLQALGLSVGRDVLAGIRLTLTHRTAARPEDEPRRRSVQEAEMMVAGCRTRTAALFRRVGSRCDGALRQFRPLPRIYFRCLDTFGDPVVRPAPAQCLHRVGFDREDALFPNDHRVFEGFDLCVSILCSRASSWVAISPAWMRSSEAGGQDRRIVFAFDEVNTRLAAAVQPSMLRCIRGAGHQPVRENHDRILLKSNQHEYHVVPDRSHYLDYEPHRLLDVHAHYAGGGKRCRFSRFIRPHWRAQRLGAILYRAPAAAPPHGRGKALGRRRLYGTDMFVSLSELGGADDDAAIAELSLRALCSNRHLTEHLPIGAGGADFQLIDDSALDLVCIAGPTPPREPIVAQLRAAARRRTRARLPGASLTCSAPIISVWSSAAPAAMLRRCGKCCRCSRT